MEFIIPALVFCQAVGALVGAGSAIMGELAHSRAMRDGHIDRAEHRHLEHLHRGLRFGMSTVLLSSFALVVTAYLNQSTPQPAATMSYWILMTLAFVVIVASWAMARKAVTVSTGSIFAFTAWWFLAYLTIGGLPITSVGAGVAAFLMAIILFAIVLTTTRRIGRRR